MFEYDRIDDGIDEEGFLPDGEDLSAGAEQESLQPGETALFTVDAEASGMRLDAWLAGLLPLYRENRRLCRLGQSRCHRPEERRLLPGCPSGSGGSGIVFRRDHDADGKGGASGRSGDPLPVVYH